ncbi:uncharacterized protein N7529_012159 [Penicillium soppii]|uniref:uncharacterized protein n=1 Tax=Penicillium soppii TaxID=69789 RepID=UPI002548470A|nr:uncharacterized protein N7529_012159 [Penicillium soppii]KAJ5852774.1 hypothetical protein N7529_012159 [Penicillium soppii]
MSKEEPVFPTISSPGASAKDPTPTRLHTVRILLSDSESHPMDDINKKGLGDVVLAAVPLQRIRAASQAQDDHSNTEDALQVEIAVYEAGIPRVWKIYGRVKFDPLSSDDPILLQQPANDLNLKKHLCNQYLRGEYEREYKRWDNHAKNLGLEIDSEFERWFEERLDDIGYRLQISG